MTNKRDALPRILLSLFIIGGIVLAVVFRDAFDIGAIREWIDSQGAMGPIVFILAYAVATIVFAPGSVFTLAGGAMFGPILGTLYSITGATLGASLAFLISRFVAGDFVSRKAGYRLQKLVAGVEEEGWRFVAFLRLVPIFPFNFVNYVLGLTRVGFWSYMIASFIFMLPGCFAYTYLGYAGASAATGDENWIEAFLIALGILAAITFITRSIKRKRLATQEKKSENRRLTP
ncbi:MAG: TVP38/TMEM64 family protein [Planctomycetes bacterium]|nr:TVP38/TMEM64 family protein [Planctomycetota bacterium]